MNKFISNNYEKYFEEQEFISLLLNTLSFMSTEIYQTNKYKLKTEPSKDDEYPLNQNQQKHFNPIVKHTYDCLPKIYGTNHHRKKKYHLNLKSNFQIKSFLQNQNSSKLNRKHQCQNTREILTQQQRQKAASCLQNSKTKQSNGRVQRNEQDKTTLKKSKNLQIATQQNFLHHSSHQLTQKKTQSGKPKRIINLDSLLNLSKPRQRCNNQYCSCKSLYDEYQNQIQKKKRQKMCQNSTGRRKINSQLKLPGLSIDINNHLNKRLNDQQSRHKVNCSRYKLNSLKQQIQLEEDDCFLCRKNRQMQDNFAAKGLLGLIKKRQQSQLLKNSQKTHRRAETQSIAIQYDDHLEEQNNHLDYATQANLNQPIKKKDKINKQVNTQEDQSQKRDFKYLQNKQFSIASSKCSCNHEDLIKDNSKSRQKFNHKNKFVIQNSKSTENQNQNNHQCKCNCKRSSNKNKEDRKRRSPKNIKNGNFDTQQQAQINIETQSALSQNSFARHLAHAISPNKSDRKTIFTLLNKKESEMSSNQDFNDSQYKNSNKRKKKTCKHINMINQKTQLFTIPQEQQYVDYLRNYKPIDKNFKLNNLIKKQNFRIIRYNDTLYFGQMQPNQTKHGQALYITPKEIFEGYYQNGIKMSGCQRNIDGVYIGQFLNGLRHGTGKFLWNNGQIFEGQYRLGTKNGFGIWKSPKGDSYEGQWRLNRQHGKGTHRHKNSVYTGQFKNSIKDGQGQELYANGDKYIGSYVKGKAHGKGRYQWKDGSVYIGQFYEGLREGYGVWNDKNNFKYQGEFKKDQKHGKGKQVYENGDSYEGEFSQGIKIDGVFKQFVSGKQTIIKQNKK